MPRKRTSAAKRARNKRVSRKFSKVAKDSPGLTSRQLKGKVFGILRSETKKRRKRKR